MPAGVPVATMAIGNAANAGLFAARILALIDPELARKLEERRARIAQAVESHGPMTGRSAFSAAANSAACSRSKRSAWATGWSRSSRLTNSPTGQIADEQIVAAYDDLRAIGELGARSDIVTYEFENIPLESVQALEADRRLVRSERRGAAHHARADAREDVRARVRDPDGAISRRCAIATNCGRRRATIGFPAVLKTTMGGYDGKGQWVVRDRRQGRGGVRAKRRPRR